MVSLAINNQPKLPQALSGLISKIPLLHNRPKDDVVIPHDRTQPQEPLVDSNSLVYAAIAHRNKPPVAEPNGQITLSRSLEATMSAK